MHDLHNEAIKKRSQNVWGSNPAGWTFGNNYQKGSKEFFQSVLQKRFSDECDWFAPVVNFARFKDKKVLEIGYGAGYDAYMFCAHGADYTGIDITPENKMIAEKHLAYFGYQPSLQCMDVEQMDFKEEFDYVFSFGVLHHTPDLCTALKNIYQALKPGGEAQIVVYNKYSLFYLFNIFLIQWLVRGNFLRRSLAEQRSYIEYTESDQRPLVNVYSTWHIKKLIKQAGFTIIKTDIRKLVQDDIPVIRKLPCTISKKLLDYIGTKIGWYISVRALKK